MITTMMIIKALIKLVFAETLPSHLQGTRMSWHTSEYRW